MKLRTTILFALAFTSSLVAQDIDTPPEIIARGVGALKQSGGGAALDVWLKGSPIEKDSTGIAKVLANISAIEKMYGRVTGLEIVQTFPISKTTSRVYGIILFEKGPIYARWDCFKGEKTDWIIPEFMINTTAGNVFPEELLYKK